MNFYYHICVLYFQVDEDSLKSALNREFETERNRWYKELERLRVAQRNEYDKMVRDYVSKEEKLARQLTTTAKTQLKSLKKTAANGTREERAAALEAASRSQESASSFQMRKFKRQRMQVLHDLKVRCALLSIRIFILSLQCTQSYSIHVTTFDWSVTRFQCIFCTSD